MSFQFFMCVEGTFYKEGMDARFNWNFTNVLKGFQFVVVVVY